MPTVNSTGKGRNVYYSTSDLLVLTLMAHLLSVGLSFEFCQKTLELLKRVKPELFEIGDSSERSVDQNFLVASTFSEERSFTTLIPFEERQLIIKKLDDSEEFLMRGTPVIPIFFKDIYRRLQYNLENAAL